MKSLGQAVKNPAFWALIAVGLRFRFCAPSAPLTARTQRTNLMRQCGVKRRRRRAMRTLRRELLLWIGVAAGTVFLWNVLTAMR
jgi:hypothetical protein